MVCAVARTSYLLRSDISKHVPSAAKKKVAKLYQIGLLTFLAGFAIWNVDNIFCNTLTEWKKAIGWPVAFLLEGASRFPPNPFVPSAEIYKQGIHGGMPSRYAFLQFVGPSPTHPDFAGYWLVLDDVSNNL